MADGYDVKKVTGIGTTAIRVGDGINGRRSLYNSGTTTLELHNAVGDAYGTGFPIPPGGVMNFDDAGKMESPIFASSSAAGGECRLIRY